MVEPTSAFSRRAWPGVELDHIGRARERLVDLAVAGVLGRAGRYLLREVHDLVAASSQRMSIGNLQFLIQIPWKSGRSNRNSIP